MTKSPRRQHQAPPPENQDVAGDVKWAKMRVGAPAKLYLQQMAGIVEEKVRHSTACAS